MSEDRTITLTLPFDLCQYNEALGKAERAMRAAIPRRSERYTLVGEKVSIARVRELKAMFLAEILGKGE